MTNDEKLDALYEKFKVKWRQKAIKVFKLQNQNITNKRKH